MTKASQRVQRTRNGGTWTNARFWSAVRSALRRAFRYWVPAVEALKAARVPVTGAGKQKWAYLCAGCQKFFKRDLVEIHHVVPVGALKAPEDLADFLARLTPESHEAYQVLCLNCHKAVTANQRQKAA